MARRPRIEFAGAVYHVISRGDHGEVIFGDDKDRGEFLRCMGEVCGRTGWFIHAFVLMSNHYHMLLETPEANLVAGMKWLQGTYTQRFNLRHGIRGHLFQGRYKALVVDGEGKGYFLQASSYIHLNPVRAGLVQADYSLGTYRWSSYPFYLVSRAKRLKWIYVDRVLGELGDHRDNERGRKIYGRYMEDLSKEYRQSEEREEFNMKWKPLREGWYLGDEEFRDHLISFLDRAIHGKKRESFSGDELREHGEAQAERFLRKGLRELELTNHDLQGRAKGVEEKQVLAWWLRKKTIVSRKWISERLQMGDASRVSKALNIVSSAKDSHIRKIKERLEGSP
ncbi:MAG: transposase [Spirochaetota bacterium]